MLITEWNITQSDNHKITQLLSVHSAQVALQITYIFIYSSKYPFLGMAFTWKWKCSFVDDTEFLHHLIQTTSLANVSLVWHLGAAAEDAVLWWYRNQQLKWCPSLPFYRQRMVLSPSAPSLSHLLHLLHWPKVRSENPALVSLPIGKFCCSIQLSHVFHQGCCKSVFRDQRATSLYFLILLRC